MSEPTVDAIPLMLAKCVSTMPSIEMVSVLSKFLSVYEEPREVRLLLGFHKTPGHLPSEPALLIIILC